MSLMKAKARSTQPAPVEQHSNKCAANGCPMLGVISPSGGRYVCAYHYSQADSKKWPQVTESLIQNEQIRLAINEVINIGDMDWVKGQWRMMESYFDNHPDLQPTQAERDHKRWYEYRLSHWLMYLAGVVSKKPIPREPLPPVKRRGNLTSFVGA